MSEDFGNVISLADRKKNSSTPAPHFEAKPAPPQRRRMLHLRAIFRKECKFGAIPDVIDRAYRAGKIDDSLLGLIHLILCSDQDFVITRGLLEGMWCADTLKKNLDAIKASGMVEIEQKQLRKGGKPSNIYHVTDPKDWDIGPLIAVSKDRLSNTPLTGGCSGTNTPPAGGCKKPNNIRKRSNTPPAGCSSKNSESNTPLEVDLRKPLKTPPAELLNLDRLRSRLRFRFSKNTPGEHIKGLVDTLCKWEQNRLMMEGTPERSAKIAARERVLALINTVPASTVREFQEGTESEWLKWLEGFVKMT